jgi:protein O-GlcNAc transferase
VAAQGDVSGAHALYSHALRLHPGSAAAWCGLAAAAAASGRSSATVMSLFREAARVEPGAAHAYIGLASCCKEAGQLDEAEAHFNTAILLRPCDARLHAFLAGLLYERGRLTEAVRAYNGALQLEPTFVEVVNDLGNAYRGLGRLEEARHCYLTCLSQHAAAGNTTTPAVAIAYSNLGAVSKLLGKNDEAISCFDVVARLQPANADAHAALASALKDAGHHELALSSYRTALSMAPQHATRAHFVHSLASVCAWDEFHGALACLTAEVRDVLAQGQPSAVQPFHAMGYDLDAQLVLQLTRAYAAQVMAAAAALKLPAFVHAPPQPVRPLMRLRVGFVSSDIGQHPLSHLMGSVFGLMDRSRIEVFLYALSDPDGSPYRARIEGETEHFFNAAHISTAELAVKIHSDGIQILIDLNGYTKNGRTEVFALRPAPVQVAYMGAQPAAISMRPNHLQSCSPGHAKPPAVVLTRARLLVRMQVFRPRPARRSLTGSSAMLWCRRRG